MTRHYWRGISALLVVALIGVIGLLVARNNFPLFSQESTSAQEPSLERTITVNGEGRVAIAPDTAQATLGVEVQHEDLSQAIDEANRRMDSVIAALQEQNIPDEQVQTVRFDIRVERDREAPGRPISGYTVINQVRVAISSPEQIGEVIDAAVSAGANEVSNIGFSVEDIEAVVRQAREQAMEDARQRASQLADLGGVTLGPPVSITEDASPPSPERPAVEPEPVEDAAPPIETGEEEVVVSVTVSYSIE